MTAGTRSPATVKSKRYSVTPLSDRSRVKVTISLSRFRCCQRDRTRDVVKRKRNTLTAGEPFNGESRVPSGGAQKRRDDAQRGLHFRVQSERRVDDEQSRGVQPVLVIAGRRSNIDIDTQNLRHTGGQHLAAE